LKNIKLKYEYIINFHSTNLTINNVTLTLTRRILLVDIADVVKNNNFLIQGGKFQFQNPKSPLALSTPTLSVSHSFNLFSFFTLSFIGGIFRSLFVHCLALLICLRLYTLHLCALCLSKRLIFYFVYVGKTCKGCSFKWFFMQKDVFFMFVEWFACKVWVFMRFFMEKEVFLVV